MNGRLSTKVALSSPVKPTAYDGIFARLSHHGFLHYQGERQAVGVIHFYGTQKISSVANHGYIEGAY